MPETHYTLEVQDALEERQIRRLGAAVCRIWPLLPEAARTKVLDEAARIVISGEHVEARELRAKLQAFVDGGLPEQSRA